MTPLPEFIIYMAVATVGVLAYIWTCDRIENAIAPWKKK